jgi:flagellar export protein FliJ
MKKFKSNLSRLHDIRKAMTNRCEASLAESMQSLAESQANHLYWQDAVSLAAENASTQTHQANTRFLECLAHRAWFQHLTSSLFQAGRHCQAKEAEVDSRREALKQAMMDEKVIENLSLRERQEWLQKMRREEQKETDEIATQNALRKSKQAEQMPSTQDDPVNEQ